MPKFPKLEQARYVGYKKSILILYNQLLRKIDKIQKRTVLLSRPISLQLEPTTKCNLRCPFCESPIWDRRGMDMKFSDFKKIIDQFPLLRILLLQGIGEPLLCKDFFKMVEYCKSKKILVGITTNGTLINKKVAEKLVNYKIDYVIMSIDGATSETFERIRVGAKFEQVIENAINLVKTRGENKKPKIIFLFTGTRDNIHELPQVVELAKEIGIDAMEAQDTHFWSDEELKERIDNRTLRKDMAYTRKFVNDAIVKAKELGIPFTWLGSGGRKTLYTDKDFQLHADPRLCQMVFRSCFITVDGYVTTCACCPDPRKLNFGNILEQNFEEIWNSPKYIAIRKARLEGKIPDYCKTCTVPHL